VSLPVSVICEPPVECCPVPAPPFYTQGLTFLSAQTGFILNCPQGFSCDAGAYPHNVIIPDGAIPYTPPTGGNPLRFVCCDGVELVRYLPTNFTQAQFNAAAQEIADTAAEHLALCEAQAYNAQNARQNQNCTISTPGTLPEAFSGTEYSQTLQQSGALAPVVWTVVGGALPRGLSLSADGVISGMPMVSGLFTFVAQATGALNPATQTRLICKRVFRITVSADVPCDLGVTDNTSFGDRGVNTFDGTSDNQWNGLILGTYTVQYISGAVQKQSVPLFPDPPFLEWIVNPQGIGEGVDSNARIVHNTSTREELPFDCDCVTIGCGFSTLAAAEAAFDKTPIQFQSFGATITVDVRNTCTFVDFVPVTWRLTRIRKSALNYQAMQLRIVNLASLLGSLAPFSGCTAGSGTVWDGTFPAFEPNLNYVNYEWRVTSGFAPFQLNGALLDTPAACKVYHDTAGQATPTGCAWILAVTYQHPVEGNVVSWVGLGGAGYAPQGTFVFSSDVVGWTMFGKKTAWRVATTAALPANTRVLNVLTANAVGALPAIDGIALSVADRVLVKNEGFGENNGSYVVTSLGSGGTPWVLTRSTDLDTSAEMLRGIFAIVTDGNTNAGLHFRLVTNGVITLNVTPLSFTAIATTIDVELF